MGDKFDLVAHARDQSPLEKAGFLKVDMPASRSEVVQCNGG